MAMSSGEPFCSASTPFLLPLYPQTHYYERHILSSKALLSYFSVKEIYCYPFFSYFVVILACFCCYYFILGHFHASSAIIILHCDPFFLQFFLSSHFYHQCLYSLTLSAVIPMFHPLSLSLSFFLTLSLSLISKSYPP